jgi:hypothetical protein
MSPLITRDEVNKPLDYYFLELGNRAEKIIDFSNQVFDWIMEKASSGDENIPIPMLFRQSIELLDAMTILFKQQSIEPCKLFLRSVFENYLSIIYLTDKDSIKRARCFLFYYYKKGLNENKRYDHSIESGREFIKKLKKDKKVGDKFLRKTPEFQKLLNEKIENLNTLIDQPEFEKIKNEYEQLKKLNRKFSWYTFYGGPKNLEGLADLLGRTASYEILYRQWSKYSHGEDPITGNLRIDSDNKGSVIQIRYGINAPTIASFFYIFTIEIYETVIKFYRPTKEKAVQNWINTTGRNFYRFIESNPIVEK